MAQVIVGRTFSERGLIVTDTDGIGFSNVRSYDFDGAVRAFAVSDDAVFIAVAHGLDLQTYFFNDGELLEAGAVISFSSNVLGMGFASHDNRLLAVSVAGDLNIYRVADNGNLTLLATNSDLSASFGKPVSWNAAGTRLVTATSNDDVGLFSWDGTTITTLDTIAIPSAPPLRPIPRFIGESSKVFVGDSDGPTIYLYDVSTDEWVQEDSQPFDCNFADQKPSPDGLLVAAGRVAEGGPAKLFAIQDNELVDLADFPQQISRPAWFSDSKTIVGTDSSIASGLLIRLFSWDGSAITSLSSVNLGAGNITTLVGILFSGIPAPTPSQIFQNTFAEVSGRDPLPTALNQRTPARNLANYNISMYLFNPQIIIKPVQINLGELSLINPAPSGTDIARLIWFDADPRDPHFKVGRWAQVLGRSGSADPGTVELELRICDNPQSFIPPS